MNFKKLQEKTIFKIATNIYIVILTIFVIWMLFFDENSYLAHKELDKEVSELETWIKYHKKEIEKDKQTIKKLEDSLELERYAREKYLMKKEHEEVFIVEFDTINAN